jgi:hypothetical protein
MSFQLKTKYVIIAIIGVFLALFIIGYIIGQRRGESASNSVISALNSEIQRKVIRIGDDSVYIAQKEQEIKTVKQAKKDGDIRNEELRKLNLKQVNEISRLKLRIDTLLSDISHTGTIITIHDTIDNTNKNAILLPFVVTKNDKWLSLKDSTDIRGITSIALKMDFGVDVWTGYDKKRNIYKAVLTYDNPYLNTVDIKSVKMDLPKVKKYGMGLQVGCGVTKELKASPYIGVGLSYNFIRF